MKTEKRSQRGFTLIELIIAIAAGAIVILATGIVVSLGQTSWNTAWRKVNLQRDASYAMLKMNKIIKSAATADVNGPVLSIDGGDIEFTYDSVDGDLESTVGGVTETILDGTVDNLVFGVSGSTVTIDLNLKEDSVEVRFVSTVMMRNSGG